MSRLLALSLALLGSVSLAPLTASADATKDLHALFDREWERDLAENPLGATYIGDPRYNDRWPDISPAAQAAREARGRESARRPRTHSPRRVVRRGKIELRPVQARLRNAQGGRAVPCGVLRRRGERRSAVAQRDRRRNAVRNGPGLRHLASANEGGSRLTRPVRRPAAPRRDGKAHAATGGHGARVAAARGADAGQAGGQPLVRPVPRISRTRSRRRSASG